MTLFFDADLGTRVARVLDLVKAPSLECVTLVDRYRHTPQHGLEIPDHVWIRDVGLEGWLALTQDRAILTRPVERKAIVEHAAGLVILEPGNAVNYDVLSFIIRRMPWLRTIDQEARPLVYRVHVRGRPRRVDLAEAIAS